MRIVRSGVSLVTLTPERVHNRESLKANPYSLIEAVITLIRANEESEIKSSRASSAWVAKRANVGERKLTSRCPPWLRLARDRKSFIVIEDKAESVRRVFQMKASGLGIKRILKTLNGEGTPGISDSKVWAKSSLATFLRNPSVIGHYQPKRLDGKKRVACGPMVEDYFPAIIAPELYYSVQGALDHSRHQRGRVGTNIANLFTSFIYDRHDGQRMRIVDKHRGKGPRLVSAGALKGLPNSVYASFPYWDFERAILAWLVMVQPADMGDGATDDLESLQAKLKSITDRIAKIQAELGDDGAVEVLVPVLKGLDQKRKAVEGEIESAKQRRATTAPDNIAELRSAWEHLQTATDETRVEIRTRIKSIVARVIERITMSVEDGDAICEVVFKAMPTTWLAIRANGWHFAESERALRKMLKPPKS
jgi:hypothetical protein